MRGLFGARRARVSVAVPLFNHAPYIAEAVASIQAQGSVVGEIIVIDDGSTDELASVMLDLASRDKRIRFRSQANQGAHSTLNTALGECSGDLVAILNSDDAFPRGRLDRLTAALDAEPEADIASSAVAFMDAQGQPVANAWYDAAMAFRRSAGDLGVTLVNGNILVTTSNFVIRRDALARLGGFAALRYAHDLDFALRALALGRRIAIVEQPLLRYRVHPANTIAEEHGRVRAEWAIVAAAYLAGLWDRANAPPIDWRIASAVQDVLLRHELARAVPLCMAYLRRHGAVTLDRNPLLADGEFLSRVQGWV